MARPVIHSRGAAFEREGVRGLFPGHELLRHDAVFLGTPSAVLAAASFRRARVLHERAERGEREPQPAAAPRLLQSCHDPERLGVALEAQQVLPFALVQAVQQSSRGVVPEVLLDRPLADVPEWWIAEVVRQAGSRNAVADVTRAAPGRQRRGCGGEPVAHQRAERAPDRGDLEGVGEPGVHVVVHRQGEDLGLVGQPPERPGEQDAVVVALEGRARLRGDLGGRTGPALVEEVPPIERGRQAGTPPERTGRGISH